MTIAYASFPLHDLKRRNANTNKTEEMYAEAANSFFQSVSMI